MTGTSRRRSAGIIVGAAAALALLAGCSTPGAAPSGSATGEADSGAQLTMWARNTSNNLAQQIVDAYNSSHENHIDLTIVPSDSYQQKVAAAAASNTLPDLLASDVVNSPNYVHQGLFQDITDKVKSLSFYDDLSHAHTDAASESGKIYGTPFLVDSSLVLYNKDLFEKAGLDPDHGPASYAEILSDAKAIRKAVGGDTYGFYFGGNCPGCNAYTMFGNLAAAGDKPFEHGGAKANIDTKAMKATLDLYRDLWKSGAVPESAESEDGTNWVTAFNEGKIGILPRGSAEFALLKDATFDWGVAALPSPDGDATSAFIGGDVASISKTSKHAAEGWDFLQWTLTEANQVDVIAKNGSLPSRVDFADNEYSKQSPQAVQAIKGEATGYTPSTRGYGNAINNSNGPWLAMIRDYVFNGNDGAIREGEKKIQAAIDAAQ
jgi:multiple sugar transport system substrate-binding protein